MPLDDIDDLKTFVDVAEKDDVSFERRAAYIGAQFRPCSAEGAGKVSQCPAFLSKFSDKPTAHHQTPALSGDVFENIDQVFECRRQHTKLRHP